MNAVFEYKNSFLYYKAKDISNLFISKELIMYSIYSSIYTFLITSLLFIGYAIMISTFKNNGTFLALDYSITCYITISLSFFAHVFKKKVLFKHIKIIRNKSNELDLDLDIKFYNFISKFSVFFNFIFIFGFFIGFFDIKHFSFLFFATSYVGVLVSIVTVVSFIISFFSFIIQVSKNLTIYIKNRKTLINLQTKVTDLKQAEERLSKDKESIIYLLENYNKFKNEEWFDCFYKNNLVKNYDEDPLNQRILKSLKTQKELTTITNE